jgi:hypothetical protein
MREFGVRARLAPWEVQSMAKENLGSDTAGAPSDPTPEPKSSWDEWISGAVYSLLILGLFAGLSRKYPAVIFGLVFSALGFAFVGGAVYLFVSALRFARRAKAADGVVVGFEERPDEDEGEYKYGIEVGNIKWSFGPKVVTKRISYYPKIEFEMGDHEKRLFTSDGGSRKPSYHVGDRVSVLYDPVQPHIARINKRDWIPIAVVAAIGSPFLIFGIRSLLIGSGVLSGSVEWE